MRYRAVIFDLDGVLCSTDEFHYRAWKTLADRLGIPFDRERNRLLRGVSREESLNIILEKGERTYSEEEKRLFAEQKNALYREQLQLLDKSALTPGVEEVLTRLSAAGVRLAIGSSSKNTPLIVEKLGVGKYFDAIVDGNAITHSKPDPEVFLKAAERLGFLPQDCLVVEDAESGVAAGKRGGFDTASFGDAAERNLGDYPLKTLSELLSLVL